nr:hypothetical protein RchiOBHm_Chr7g0200261 [Ipomoea batatas]
MPDFSSMSKSIGVMSPSSFHWNEFSNDPTIIGTIRIAIGNAGQILLPVPNGMSSKSCPLTSTCKFQNLSGLKINGFSQILVSRPIAHTLTRTCESLGIVYPHRVTSCSTLRIINGVGGCNRRVSFMTHCKSSAIVHSNVLDEGSPKSCTPKVHSFPYMAFILAIHNKLLDLSNPQLLIGVEFTARKDGRNHDLAKGSPLRGDGKPNDRELAMVVSSEGIRDWPG